MERQRGDGLKMATNRAGTALERSASQKEITMNFSIRFWGVRGSIASPGPETALVGGNTSCVEVTCGEQRIILDSGTGIRALGDALMKAGPVEATLLLSHHHWDHIQGLPFFVPLYLPTTRISVVGPQTERHSMHDVL